MTSSTTPSRWHKHVHKFNIDNYLNPYIPRPRFYILPRPISHFFGYRPPQSPPNPPPNPVIWLSGMIGGFIGIVIISAVYHALPMLGGEQVPIVIASFGAAAILEYNTIESPLSQPRNIIVGHFLSALIGVGITKGFEHLPAERFDSLRWLAGAVSVGVASFVMGATNTVHPPAGATALLAATSTEITELGWWLLPLVVLASSLMVASALIINNLTRKWPVYWWTPADLSKKNPNDDIKTIRDVEKQVETKTSSILSGSTPNASSENLHHDARSEQGSVPGSETTVGEDTSATARHHKTDELHMLITPDHIVVPDWMQLNDWETEVLETFRQKLHAQRADGQR